MGARAAVLRFTAVLVSIAMRGDAAEPPILECTIDRVETVTADAKRRITPMRAVDGKQVSRTLIVAGLGTPTVTAKANVYTLALGERVLPMPAGPGQEDNNDWFYARSDQGVTVLQIPKAGRPNVEVRLHNLGMVPYTYVGRCH